MELNVKNAQKVPFPLFFSNIKRTDFKRTHSKKCSGNNFSHEHGRMEAVVYVNEKHSYRRTGSENKKLGVFLPRACTF